MNMKAAAAVLVFVFLQCCSAALALQENIVLVIVDDQEYESMMQDPDPEEDEDPMPQLRSLIKAKGATFTNFFTTTPSCCISRATIFSGKYGHHCGVTGNTRGDGCYSNKWRNNQEPNAFPGVIYGESAGSENTAYNKFFMGKYLNQYGSIGCIVPYGWDSWHGVTKGSYYNYTLCEGSYSSSDSNGTETTYGSTEDDYITIQMATKAKTFLEEQDHSKPFLMVLAPPNPHGPTTYIDGDYYYANNFTSMNAWTNAANDASPGDKHYLMRYVEDEDSRRAGLGLDEVDEDWIKENADEKFRDRYRTLRHVDDMVKAVVDELDDKGFPSNTFFIYTSDNGYHFNQHGRVHGKWLHYDTDIRVPFFIRGPGIREGIQIQQAVLNMDLAPTILEIAGFSIPSDYAGNSFLSLARTGADSSWREDFLVEYWGTASTAINTDCEVATSTYTTDSGGTGNCCAITKEIIGTCPDNCTATDTCKNSDCSTDFSACLIINECICADHLDNMYFCVRKVVVEQDFDGTDEITSNYVYCSFENDGDAEMGEPFVEAYNLLTDEYQTNNLMQDTDGVSTEEEEYYDGRITALKDCDSYESCQ